MSQLENKLMYKCMNSSHIKPFVNVRWKEISTQQVQTEGWKGKAERDE